MAVDQEEVAVVREELEVEAQALANALRLNLLQRHKGKEHQSLQRFFCHLLIRHKSHHRFFLLVIASE